MPRPVAFTDANVIYAAASRDLLVGLAVAKVITLRWSEAVHREWTEALIKNRPDLDPLRIRRTHQLLIQALPDALVAGYEPIVPTLELPNTAGKIPDNLCPDLVVGASVSGNAWGWGQDLPFCVPGRSART
jgi:hypothetical protein